ncbi:MAG: pentapeptide repeat-containing protein [Bacteroidetes bacterium]|nr:MAG: pentapeptide repeat-containing protein [Bacteroidota bacterium]
MSRKHFYEETFKNRDFSTEAFPEGEYECCLFEGCNLEHVDLSEIRFLESEFVDCNLSNVKLNGTALQEVRFKDCKMLGLLFEQCKDFGFEVSFEHCQLNHSSFYQVQLTRCLFQGCQLEEVDFTESVLREARLKACDLRNAIFENTDLEKADFRTSFNYSINPELNQIKGAIFSMPDVIGLLDKYPIQIEE